MKGFMKFCLMLAAGLGFSPDPERIIPEGDDAACAKKAVELAREGRAGKDRG